MNEKNVIILSGREELRWMTGSQIINNQIIPQKGF